MEQKNKDGWGQSIITKNETVSADERTVIEI